MRRSLVVVVVSWLVVVAIGSTLVWAVISRVGDGLGTTSGSPISSVPTPSSGSPSGTPSGSSTGTPSIEAHRATWQGLGGTVVAGCTGDAIRQMSLQPDPGFRVEVGNAGPDELEVEFEGREDEEGSASKVRAVCEKGVPLFTSEIED